MANVNAGNQNNSFTSIHDYPTTISTKIGLDLDDHFLNINIITAFFICFNIDEEILKYPYDESFDFNYTNNKQKNYYILFNNFYTLLYDKIKINIIRYLSSNEIYTCWQDFYHSADDFDKNKKQDHIDWYEKMKMYFNTILSGTLKSPNLTGDPNDKDELIQIFNIYSHFFFFVVVSMVHKNIKCKSNVIASMLEKLIEHYNKKYNEAITFQIDSFYSKKIIDDKNLGIKVQIEYVDNLNEKNDQKENKYTINQKVESGEKFLLLSFVLSSEYAKIFKVYNCGNHNRYESMCVFDSSRTGNFMNFRVTR
ncbi:hypothetical protein GVAV_002142 [Gurleya vavrai]